MNKNKKNDRRITEIIFLFFNIKMDIKVDISTVCLIIIILLVIWSIIFDSLNTYYNINNNDILDD